MPRSLCFLNLPYELEEYIFNWKKKILLSQQKTIDSITTQKLFSELIKRCQKINCLNDHKQYKTYYRELLDISLNNANNSNYYIKHEFLNLMIYTKLHYSNFIVSHNIYALDDLIYELDKNIILKNFNTNNSNNTLDIVDLKMIDYWENININEKKKKISIMHDSIKNKFIKHGGLINNRIKNIGEICYNELRLHLLNNKEI